MNELERALTADSYAAPPEHILEGIDEELAHRTTYGAPHTIYAELWHIAYWQQISLDWVEGRETPIPAHASFGFPDAYQESEESWERLRARFFAGMQAAGRHAADGDRLDEPVRCPSLPPLPTRVMTVREQLESLAAHNAYHLGRIVLLRQLAGAWPPASGGFTW